MRWILILLAIVGVVSSSLALREHYRTDTSPCSINERWDCGIVNHSPYAVLAGVVGSLSNDPTLHLALVGGIPVAAIGIAGYLVLTALSLRKCYRVMLICTLAALGFSLYLAWIEKNLLGVWCIYCVISLGTISAMALLNLFTVLFALVRRSEKA
jgi:uncharacterized membrane protein